MTREPTTPARQAPESPRLSPVFLTLVLSLAFALPLLIRLRFLTTPFERDEGEYAYAGGLILDGIPPFAQAFNMKMPGIYAAYAVVMALFGRTVAGIHLGLLLVQCGVTFAMFRLGRRVGGTRVGAMAAALYGILSLSVSVLGLFPNAEFWVLLPALAGLCVLLTAADSARWYSLALAGALLGTGCVMKQHGIAFVALGFTFLLWRQWAERHPERPDFAETAGPGAAPASSPAATVPLAAQWAGFLAGALLPFLAVCAWMGVAGVFERFRFWTFTYARHYVAQVTVPQGLGNLSDEMATITATAPLVWLLAVVGLFALPGRRSLPPARRAFPALFLGFSFLATCPGLFFRQHYFILLLPSVALLAALGLDRVHTFTCERAGQRRGNGVLLLLLTLACALPLLREQRAFFRLTPSELSRLAYGGDPFPESAEIASWIKSHTRPTDRIAVIGSEPQLYFLAGRKAATGFIYMYPLMEEQPFALEMQEALIRDLEQATPTILVYVNTTTSWLQRPKSHRRLFEWLDPVLRTYYRPVLFADIRTHDRTDYVWGEKAGRYTPQARNWVAVFQISGPQAERTDHPPTSPPEPPP